MVEGFVMHCSIDVMVISWCLWTGAAAIPTPPLYVNMHLTWMYHSPLFQMRVIWSLIGFVLGGYVVLEHLFRKLSVPGFQFEFNFCGWDGCRSGSYWWGASVKSLCPKAPLNIPPPPHLGSDLIYPYPWRLMEPLGFQKALWVLSPTGDSLDELVEDREITLWRPFHPYAKLAPLFPSVLSGKWSCQQDESEIYLILAF